VSDPDDTELMAKLRAVLEDDHYGTTACSLRQVAILRALADEIETCAHDALSVT
jgi:hypothetical protein